AGARRPLAGERDRALSHQPHRARDRDPEPRGARLRRRDHRCAQRGRSPAHPPAHAAAQHLDARPLHAGGEREHALDGRQGRERLQRARLLVGAGRLAPDVVFHLRDQRADRRDGEDRDRARAAGRALLMRYTYSREQLAWRDEVGRFLRRAAMYSAAAHAGPDAGTDLASLKTRAGLDGDEWVINGQKLWNTGAHTASHNWVAVRTEPEAPKHKGISMMIVPMDRAGITVQPLWTWSGIRTNAVFFEDVRVPRDHLVGERGMGFYYAMMALDFERIMIGSVGMIRRMLDEL